MADSGDVTRLLGRVRESVASTRWSQPKPFARFAAFA